MDIIKNNNKRIFLILVTSIVCILTGIFGSVNAAELKTNLETVKKASETKSFGDGKGEFSKTIVESNPDNGEVTIELKLSNIVEEKEGTEVFFVVDNSPSMDFVTASGKTRKEIVLNSASKLVEAIFDNSSDVKVGLIDFHGNGFLESASIYNASLRQKLTDNKSEMISAINSQLSRSTSSGTNIEAGLKTAQKNFSNNTKNKVIILLTDGIPNADVSGNTSGNDTTTDKAIIIQDNTKQALLDLKSDGIYTITMLTGMSEEDGSTDKSGTVYTSTSTIEDDLKAAERIFGTSKKPTADKYYLAKSADVDSIINKDILVDVKSKISQPINNVKIVDYFPKDITDNFEFSYVSKPNIGTKTDKIDTKSNTITWDIGTLKDNETATLRYKLKIKDMKNADLLNKTIATNEKAVLTYTDANSKDRTITLDSSPKIKLAEVKEELTAKVTYNTTTTTTGSVVATIKTNKKVNKVDGWKLSEDGKTLTKTYSKNKTETVHLEDIDGMTADVEVKIENITSSSSSTDSKKSDSKDNSIAKKDGTVTPRKNLPQAGANIIILAIILVLAILSIFGYKKYKHI